MEFEKRRIKTIEVLEPAHETVMRQWLKDVKREVIERHLANPEFGKDEGLNRILLFLIEEWQSLQLNKFMLACDPDELYDISMIMIRDAQRRQKKRDPLKSKGPVTIALKKLDELRKRIIDGIMDNTLLYVYSENMKLNIKHLTALTIYVLKHHTSLSNPTICHILNTLRMDADFNPDKNGPGRIRMRWKDYQDPDSHAMRHYKALRDHALK